MPIFICSLLSIPIYAGLMLSKNLYLSIALYFLIGLCQVGKVGVTFVYMMEFIEEKYQPFFGTFAGLADGGTLLYLAIYFKYITKNWLFYQIFGISNLVLATIALLALPESPHFLYSNGKFT